MSRIIDFSGFRPFNLSNPVLINNPQNNNQNQSNHLNSPMDEIPDLLKLIQELYPGKILFSIQEMSKISNLSYEFIRRQIANGNIKSIQFGDRKMVTIAELIFILNNGVTNGHTTIN